MGLESFELACQHLMVCITADEHDIVEVAEQCHLVRVESEPCVNSFLDHSSLRILTQVLIVEDDVILYKTVLELSFGVKKIPLLSVICTVTSSVIMAFCYIKTLSAR